MAERDVPSEAPSPDLDAIRERLSDADLDYWRAKSRDGLHVSSWVVLDLLDLLAAERADRERLRAIEVAARSFVVKHDESDSDDSYASGMMSDRALSVLRGLLGL